MKKLTVKYFNGSVNKEMTFHGYTYDQVYAIISARFPQSYIWHIE